ncbi:MAG: site-2 protease family protein [Candidatus Omnitrophica bacterium]|nr:site-2 protease family protein [Candidatus Omnitrophota bacterium]
MNPIFLITLLVVLFFSVIIHENAHGYAALLSGDDTAKLMGRLTLNPLPHIDLMGTIFLPIFMLLLSGGRFAFGWAKPVPINPYNFRDYKRGIFFTGIAGPLSNIGLAFCFAFVFRLFPGGTRSPFGLLLAYGCLINLLLAIFNLIPIPPLDGSRVVSGLLPAHLEASYRRLEPFGIFIVMFLFISGLFNVIWRIVEALGAILLGTTISI